MNQKKQIEYTDKETGEVFKGSATEIAKHFKISVHTVYKNLKQDSKVEPAKLSKVEIISKVEKQKSGKIDDTIHKEPCSKCGQQTFHRIDGIAQCFGNCTKTVKVKKVPYQPKTCVEGTSPYIVNVIERINNNLKDRMFNPTKHYEPA